jgi:hypothetical protein
MHSNIEERMFVKYFSKKISMFVYLKNEENSIIRYGVAVTFSPFTAEPRVRLPVSEPLFSFLLLLIIKFNQFPLKDIQLYNLL